MKRTIAVVVLVIALCVTGYFTEWRYSSDMQAHIDIVNTDLANADQQAAFA